MHFTLSYVVESATSTNIQVIQVIVKAKYLDAQDVCVFELAPARNTLPSFEAGSHIDVHIADGLVRQYSLCNAPHQSDVYVIGVLKEAESRGGSIRMHELHPGQELSISEPRNHFPLAHDADRSLLFAGGIGVTPILCMAERLAMIDADFRMHYCTRSRERTAFHSRITSSSLAAHVDFHFDDGPPEQKLDVASVLRTPAPGTHLYVCGPGGFMNWILSTARENGWPEVQLHKEYFAAPAQAPQPSGERSFCVRLSSTGAEFLIPPDRTVVSVLAEHGIDIPVSCEQGVCGTCLTRILAGEPDHRDVFLTDAERAANDQFTPCCSRSVSERLVLDL